MPLATCLASLASLIWSLARPESAADLLGNDGFLYLCLCLCRCLSRLSRLFLFLVPLLLTLPLAGPTLALLWPPLSLAPTVLMPRTH